MSLLQRLVAENGVLILDGAMGTELQKYKGSLDPTLWSAECLVTDPQAIVGVHCDYLRAGADIITSASYQVSYEGFQSCLGYSREKTDEVVRTATELVRRAIRETNLDNKFVASSIGCYGAHLADGSEFVGQYGKTKQELMDFHSAILPAHMSTGADILAFETVPCFEEVKAITTLISRSEQPFQAWLSMSCRSSTQLSDGSLLEDVCRKIEDLFFPDHTSHSNLANLAIGINCTKPQYISDLLSILRDGLRRDRVLLVYPNRGETYNAVTQCFDATGFGVEAASFAQCALDWKERGASAIGSCCRTDPGFTAELKKVLRGV
ncbi:homocysteine S-methyltransferase [archaeon]|nr:MAG: homocysteine S-methyltransferase [archaeon]